MSSSDDVRPGRQRASPGDGPPGGSGGTLVVDVGTVVRPVSRVGTGSLYGLRDASSPPASVLQPLRVNQLRQPPPGTEHRPNGYPAPVGDTLVVAPTALAVGAGITVDMADSLDGFPYRWAGWPDWLSRVDRMIAAARARPDITNITAWEPWNEPDWTWPSDAGSWTDGWARTYRRIRAKTDAPVLGPSDSKWSTARMRSFLVAAKASGTLPDVVSWHELSGWQPVTSNIRAYRALERELGIRTRPISINEYAQPDEVDVPSAANHYVAQFEREGVRDAERAFWFEAGTMNGLLHDDRPTASYWMYAWYADQTGDIVAVTPTVSNDGVAAYDGDRRVASLVFGGHAGNAAVRLDGMQAFGAVAHVTLDHVAGTGRTTNVAAPTTLWTRRFPVVGGSVTVPIEDEDPLGAYRLLLAPG